MESTLNIAFAELEELYQSATELYELKYYDAAVHYCVRFANRLLIEISKVENIDNNYFFDFPTEAVIDKIRESKNIFFQDTKRELEEAINRLSDPEKASVSTNLEDTKLLLEWFKEYVSYKWNKENYKIKKNGLLNLTKTIQAIEIKNYLCIEELVIDNLPIDNQFIVFTGENGYGKTTILQAIAIALCGGFDEQSNELLLNEEGSAVGITIHENGQFINQVITNTNRNLKAVKDKLIKAIPNVVAYGASRLQIEAPESMYEYKKKRSPIYSLFHTEGVLQNIEYWLLNEASDIQQYQVKDLLLKVLPHIEDIKFNKKPQSVSYIEKKQTLDATQLSAGHKNILGMVGDMLIRLYRQQPQVVSPSDLTGIVLIDEIEAHLHPKWQREFPKLLSTIFPKIQFIVTTHSVITFLGMPKNSVFFNVSRSENGGTEVKRVDIDVANFLPHQILTSPIFGMENVLSVENTDFGKIRTENTYDEVVEHDKIRTELKSLSQNFKFPQHLKAL